MKIINLSRTFLPELITGILIFLFVYTASSKLFQWDTFNSALQKAPLLKNYTEMAAWSIPLIEFAIASLLFFPKTRLIGLYSALSLLIVFTIYIGCMILFVPHLPCSCGGVLQQMSWKQHLLFNIFFVIVSCFGIYLERPGSQDAANTDPLISS